MNFTSRTSYDPSNYADVSLPTSTTRTRPRPLSSRDQNAYDKALLHHEQKQYNQEYFKRKNNKAASSSTTTPPTNIRNQQYQFRLSFEDWVKLKSKQTSASRPFTKSSSKKQIATATSTTSSSSTEYNNWLKQDQDKRRKKKRLETSLAKEKRQEQLERKERREELHQKYEEIERKERIQRTQRLRQQKAQRLQLKHEKEIELEAIEKELIQKRKLVYDQWKARKRREQTMINEAKRTATLRRNRDPRYVQKTTSMTKNNAGIGGMTELEQAVDLDQMLEMHRRSLGLPRESVPMMSYGGFRTGLLKVETFPRTQLYRKSLEHLGREEEDVVVVEDEEEFDIVETVDDFIERSVENLEDTLEGMVLEE